MHNHGLITLCKEVIESLRKQKELDFVTHLGMVEDYYTSVPKRRSGVYGVFQELPIPISFIINSHDPLLVLTDFLFGKEVDRHGYIRVKTTEDRYIHFQVSRHLPTLGSVVGMVGLKSILVVREGTITELKVK